MDFKFKVGDLVRLSVPEKDVEHLRMFENMSKKLSSKEIYKISSREFAHDTKWYSLKGAIAPSNPNWDIEDYFEKIISLKQILEDIK